MNGGQDLGGMMGLGPVVPEKDEPVFHARWESRVLSINVAVGACGLWNIDMSRHARENIHPRDYLTLSYYEIWLGGLETLVRHTGMATAGELASGTANTTPIPVKRVLKADEVTPALTRGWPSERQTNTVATFKVGDRVRARVINPSGHTRLPRYARGREGIVEAVRGCHVFPDSNAATMQENPCWLYTVRFAGTELWGPQADARTSVSIDAFEPYLEPA